MSAVAGALLECGGNDAALAELSRKASQSGVAATLCHRTPKGERDFQARLKRLEASSTLARGCAIK